MPQKEQTGLFFETQKRQPKYLRDTGDSVKWTSKDAEGKEYGKWPTPLVTLPSWGSWPIKPSSAAPSPSRR